MPLYEYKCRSCDKKFEVRRGLMDKRTDVKCPECGSGDTERVFSTTYGGGSCGSSERRIPFG
jgi:putative FmdB family regulatory protein